MSLHSFFGTLGPESFSSKRKLAVSLPVSVSDDIHYLYTVLVRKPRNKLTSGCTSVDTVPCGEDERI